VKIYDEEKMRSLADAYAAACVDYAIANSLHELGVPDPKGTTETLRATALAKRKTLLGYLVEGETVTEQVNPPAVQRFLREVGHELERARKLFPGDRIMTLALAEEFGETVKAVLDEPSQHVWKEAVQAATMAARVVIDGDNSVDNWRAAKGLDALTAEAGLS
jgi:regulator of extracellular matrix RemA (YlzA/DUF370 family)